MTQRRRKRRRPYTLKSILSSELHCSKRRIYVGAPHLDPVEDRQVCEFLSVDKTDELDLGEGSCDILAVVFRANAKRWFIKRGLNAMIGEIWVYKTKETVPHAFAFSVKPNYKLTFWEPAEDRERDRRARVQLVVI